MKQILLAITVFITLQASAQANISNASTIPVAVTDAFLKKFPNTTDVKWSPNTFTTPTATSVYVVEFKTNVNESSEAWIDTDGNIIKYKKDIASAELPDAVKTAADKNFHDATIDSIKRIEEKGRISYKFSIKNRSQERDVVMDDTGNIKN